MNKLPYPYAILEQAKRLHNESVSCLDFTTVVNAYYNHGHSAESFLKNMKERSLYSDLCDLDDMQIEPSAFEIS